MKHRLDLTHPLSVGASSPPGAPAFALNRIRTMASHGRNSSAMELSVHTGTHLDAPFHVDDAGADITSIPADRLTGSAVVLGIALDEARAIEVADLVDCRPSPQKGDMALLATGWSRFYGTPRYRVGPWLSIEAAEWLVAQGVKLVGIDLKGPEAPHRSTPGAGEAAVALGVDFRVHHVLLDNGVLLVENLANLGPLVGRRVTVSVHPLPIKGADGAPAVVLAEYED